MRYRCRVALHNENTSLHRSLPCRIQTSRTRPPKRFGGWKRLTCQGQWSHLSCWHRRNREGVPSGQLVCSRPAPFLVPILRRCRVVRRCDDPAADSSERDRKISPLWERGTSGWRTPLQARMRWTASGFGYLRDPDNLGSLSIRLTGGCW